MAVMNEEMGAQLDPSFKLTAVIAPYVQRFMLKQYSPEALARRLSKAGHDAAHLWIELPQQLRRIAGEIERGSVEVGVRPERLRARAETPRAAHQPARLGDHHSRLYRRVGGADVRLPTGGGWEGLLGPFFAFGFVVAAALGLYLAWSIPRSGRR